MNIRLIASIGMALATTVAGFANSGTLTAERPSTPAGAEVALTASANFSKTPAAVGWTVTLPEGWSYVATTGPAAPQVTPQVGDTGTLEWAYTETPASGASFGFKVKAGAKAGVVRITGKVVVLTENKSENVEVGAVVLSVTP